jgi:hypothetical protein
VPEPVIRLALPKICPQPGAPKTHRRSTPLRSRICRKIIDLKGHRK